MNRPLRQWGLCLALLGLAAPTQALETHFGGFGTANLSCFGNGDADYVINAQPEGPGRTRHCDTGLDSLLGVQIDTALNEQVEFGLQGVADRNVGRNFTPEVTVAQVRWHVSDSTTLRLGRMATASLLHAEDRQVRYAMPWVRPPLEVYNLMPQYIHDGLDFIHEGEWGSWRTEWQGGLTHADFDMPLSNQSDTYALESNTAFLHLALRQAGTEYKLGYAYGQATISNATMDQLFNQMRSALPEGNALVDDLAVQDSPSHFLVVGFKREQGDWLLMSEIAYRSLRGLIRDQYGAYVTLGRRYGDWMPYATLARRWTSGPESDSRALGPFKAPVDELLAASRFDTTSVSLGLSRDLGKQATLKLQADWIKPDEQSWGLFTNHAYGMADPGYLNPRHTWLFSMGVDFIF
jgi:hypothetical protein